MDLLATACLSPAAAGGHNGPRRYPPTATIGRQPTRRGSLGSPAARYEAPGQQRNRGGGRHRPGPAMTGHQGSSWAADGSSASAPQFWTTSTVSRPAAATNVSKAAARTAAGSSQPCLPGAARRGTVPAARRARGRPPAALLDLAQYPLFPRTAPVPACRAAAGGSRGDRQAAARQLYWRAMTGYIDERLREAVTQLGHLARLPAAPAELFRFCSPQATRGHALAFPGRRPDRTDGDRPGPARRAGIELPRAGVRMPVAPRRGAGVRRRRRSRRRSRRW